MEEYVHGVGILLPIESGDVWISEAMLTVDPVDGGDIFVTGSRVPWWEIYQGSNGDFYTGYYEGSELGVGGGSSDQSAEPNDCRDRQALEAEKEIEKRDDDEKEYASVLFRDASGKLQRSPPLEGTLEGVPLSEMIRWINENGIPMSEVVGFVHNHPDYEYGTSPEAIAVNRYPSGGEVKGGDWIAAERMVNAGAGGPNGEGFALYLIDAEGNLREFKYSDRSMYEGLSQAQRENGKELPKQLKDDGTSCSG